MPELIPPDPKAETLSRTQILVALGVTAVVLLLLSRLWLFFDPIEGLPVNWSGWAVVWGLSLGLGITLASAAVYQLWEAYRRSADFYIELVVKPLTWVDLIWIGLLPGLSEELLFRGVMLPAIGLTWYGLVVSSACFGVLHYSGSQHWSYVIWATFIGLALGYSAIATGNLLIPIVAHITTNLISSCIWKFSVQG
jgi:membrane protease YdiL (CAAX protease family)